MTEKHTPPPTPQDLKARMSNAFNDFLTACKTLTPKQWQHPDVCGEWSAKQVVDHLTGWQLKSLTILDSLANTAFNTFDNDIDSFNASSVEDRKTLSWQESLEDFERSYQTFDQALSKVSEAQFRANQGFASWIKAMIHEYDFHLSHIQGAQDL